MKLIRLSNNSTPASTKELSVVDMIWWSICIQLYLPILFTHKTR